MISNRYHRARGAKDMSEGLAAMVYIQIAKSLFEVIWFRHLHVDICLSSG